MEKTINNFHLYNIMRERYRSARAASDSCAAVTLAARAHHALPYSLKAIVFETF